MCAFDRSGHAGSIALNYRDLIGRALANGAAGLLLIHNHPSGNPTPSKADVASTRALAALCAPLEITVHDHLVVGGDRVVSMRRTGLFASYGSPA
ncbi:JAB domain-containing protein [Tsuneonella sp. HG094]